MATGVWLLALWVGIYSQAVKAGDKVPTTKSQKMDFILVLQVEDL